MLQGAGAAGAGEWTGTSYTTKTSSKTSQRTYIDSDGTEVTEVMTTFLNTVESRHRLSTTSRLKYILHGTAVERRSVTGELALSYTGSAADG